MTHVGIPGLELILSSLVETVYCWILWVWWVLIHHYYDVIMTTVASPITSLTVICSIVYSGADQRKHQSSASLAFLRGIYRDRWIPRIKGQQRGKWFHLMTSSCMLVRRYRVPYIANNKPISQISECICAISHNANFVTEMFTCVHIFVTKWCSVGYLFDALWDL